MGTSASNSQTLPFQPRANAASWEATASRHMGHVDPRGESANQVAARRSARRRRAGSLELARPSAETSTIVASASTDTRRHHGRWRAAIGVNGASPSRCRQRASSGSRQPEFFSTHPHPENRQARIREEIAKRFPSGVPEGLKK